MASKAAALGTRVYKYICNLEFLLYSVQRGGRRTRGDTVLEEDGASNKAT